MRRWPSASSWAPLPIAPCARIRAASVSVSRWPAAPLVALPKLLLLDEPTTGLDAKGVTRVGQVVREEVARGAYVVLVTHDADFARAYGDRSVEMERGRIRN